jgi:GTPase Era involved in 16S rRNA processing
MRSLSERLGFCVTVVIAPSASRLHGAQFEGFPKLSERSHFADYVRELAHEQGFRVTNLVEEMAPYADEELLYYRDDHHWNPRGNALAAELIRAALATGCGTGGS